MTAAGSTPPEFIRGVPHALPAGEHVLWEGAPGARAVARHVFHMRWFAGYFTAMLVIWAFSTDLRGTDQFWVGFAWRFALTVAALGIVEGLSHAVARTTWYAITNRRVVLRIGIVLPMSINIPFRLLSSADVIEYRDGTGQVAMQLEKEHRIAYIALWPHCKAFTFTNPSPLLRGIKEPKRVGETLARAVAAGSADVAVERERAFADPPRANALIPSGV